LLELVVPVPCGATQAERTSANGATTANNFFTDFILFSAFKICGYCAEVYRNKKSKNES
jgi:hypothetical protein